MSRLDPLPPEELSQQQRELYEAIIGGPRGAGVQHFALTDERGALRGPFNAFLLSPSVGAAVQQLGASLRYESAMSPRCREIAILLVAARWRSEFERESHESIARSLEVSEEELRQLAREEIPASLNRTERVMARLTIELLDGDIDDEAWNELVNEIGVDTFFELTSIVGYYSLLALQLRVFRVL